MRIIYLFLISLWSVQLLAQQPNEVWCGTSDDLPEQVIAAMQRSTTLGANERSGEASLREFRLAFDIRYATLRRFGGDKDAVRWLIYQRVSALSRQFEQDVQLRLSVSHIHFWDQPDGYDATTIFSALASCRAFWRSQQQVIERDAVVLYDDGLPGAAGYAYSFNSCNNDQAYLACNALSDNVVGYDNLLAHELGHMLGVAHTHSCQWAGGPLDSCFQLEGNCASPGFQRIRKAGHLMSYCNPDAKGFHPQAKAVIRANAGSLCWRAVTEVPLVPRPVSPFNATIQGHSAYLYSQSVRLAKQYDWQMASDSAFRQVVYTTTTDFSMLPVYTLKANTTYFWRVRAKNDIGASSWSAVARFTTGNSATATVPEPIYPKYYTDTAATVAGIYRFKAVPGALSYRLRLYESQVPFVRQVVLTDTFWIDPLTSSFPNTYQAWTVEVFQTNDGNLTAGTACPPQVFLHPNPASATALPVQSAPNGAFPLVFKAVSFIDTVQYEWQIATDADFRQVVSVKKGILPPDVFTDAQPAWEKWCTVLPDSLPAGLYYRRWRQGTRRFAGNWTNSGAFRVYEEKQYAAFTWQNSPLPPGELYDIAISPVNGEKWIATSNGLFRTRDGQRWMRYTPQNTQFKVPQRLGRLAFDKNGQIWTANLQYGISRFDGQQWMLYPVGFDVPEALRGAIQDVAPDGRGGVWFSWGTTQVWYFDPSTNALRLIVDGAAERRFVRWLKTTADGVLWIGFSNGIVRLENGQLKPVPAPPNAININFDGQPTFDAAGRCWMPAVGGLAQWSGVGWSMFRAPIPATTMPQAAATVPGQDSLIWLSNQGQALRYNRLRNTWLMTLETLTAHAMVVDSNQRLWLANRESGVLTAIQTANLKSAQSIDFNPISSRIITEGPLTLVAAATSGLPVRFSVASGGAVLSDGNRLSFSAAGAVVLEATQDGNATILPAIPVQQRFCVIPARPSIRQDSLNTNILYSGSPVNNQWYLEGLPIAGATQPTWRAEREGFYAVVVQNKDGCPASAPSNTVSIQWNQPQTLQFSPIADKTVGDPAFPVRVTASSGLPVVITLERGPATLTNGRSLTPTGPGRIVLRASQAGNQQYLPVSATYNFCVLPATPVISRDPALLRYLKSSSPVGNRWMLNDTLLPNATQPTLWAAQEGLYRVRVANTDGCPDSRPSASAGVFKTPQTINFQQNGGVVVGAGSVILRAKASSGLPILFVVTNGVTEQRDSILTPTAAGLITIKAVQPGNDQYAYAETTRSFCAIPPKPTIRRDSTHVLYSSSLTSNQWWRNDTLLAGANQPFYIATAPGLYQVSVGNTGGCPGSVRSDTVRVMLRASGRDNGASTAIQHSSTSLKVYPNPVASSLSIFTNNPFNLIEVYDGLGRRIQRFESKILQHSCVLDTENWPTGACWLAVRGPNGFYSGQLIVKKAVGER
jgi:ligand-binding sensor domain-containing protein